ncbi:CoA-transferase [soil metagenome]
MDASSPSLAELLIVACAEAWRDAGEIVATGVGPVPRLAAGLAKSTFEPELLMTDGEAYLVEDPLPIGPRDYDHGRSAGYLPFSRFFEAAVWSGRRHAMVTPTQIDRFGQTNLSCLGGTYQQPKVQMLGARGFPGNSIHHPNSMFIPAHSTRVFVGGEVDMVSSVGYNPARRINGANFSDLDLRLIVTDLCVLDFGGVDNAIRIVALHPGVTKEQVHAATGFALAEAETLATTRVPTADELAVIAKLDPHNIRATVIKGNPAALREVLA